MTDDNVRETSKKPKKMKRVLDDEEEDFAKFLESEDPTLLDFENEDLNDSSDEESAGNEGSFEEQSEFVGDENDIDFEGNDLEPEDNLNQSMAKGFRKWAKAFDDSKATIETCRSVLRAFVEVIIFRDL